MALAACLPLFWKRERAQKKTQKKERVTRAGETVSRPQRRKGGGMERNSEGPGAADAAGKTRAQKMSAISAQRRMEASTGGRALTIPEREAPLKPPTASSMVEATNTWQLELMLWGAVWLAPPEVAVEVLNVEPEGSCWLFGAVAGIERGWCRHGKVMARRIPYGDMIWAHETCREGIEGKVIAQERLVECHVRKIIVEMFIRFRDGTPESLRGRGSAYQFVMNGGPEREVSSLGQVRALPKPTRCPPVASRLLRPHASSVLLPV